MDIFIEISNIQAKIYEDTELFAQMTPYIIINNQYITNIGLGKDDLFWKVSLLFPISSAFTTNLSFIVQDKDMFFDDYIGNTVAIISPFDIKK
jgi:hypothetical protein